MIEWAMKYPYLTTLIIIFGAPVPFNFVLRMTCRTYRMFQIMVRGWPVHPFMDADGDLVYRKQNEVTK